MFMNDDDKYKMVEYIFDNSINSDTKIITMNIASGCKQYIVIEVIAIDIIR